MFYLGNYGVLLILLFFGSTMLPKKIGLAIQGKLGEGSWLLLLLKCIFYAGIFVVSVAYLVDATYNPFLYFRF